MKERRFIAILQNPKFIELVEAKMIHLDQILIFGGMAGIRDKGLLESSLSEAKAGLTGEVLDATICQLAAAYLYNIITNQPFIDGNERTAFAIMDSFLKVNNYNLILTNEQAYNLVKQVVSKEINKDELIKVLETKIVKS